MWAGKMYRAAVGMIFRSAKDIMGTPFLGKAWVYRGPQNPGPILSLALRTTSLKMTY